MIASSDHITGLTGKSGSVAVKISKNGASGVTPSGAITEIDATNAPGWYQVAANSTDSNTLGPLILHAKDAASDPCDDVFPVVAYNPQASSNLGLSALPTAAAGANTGLPVVGTQIPNAIAAATGGLPTVDSSNRVTALVSVGTGSGQVNASGGKVPATLASTDVTGNVASDIQTIKTRTVTATATVDLDDLSADVDAIETRVVLSLPAVAPAASGGLGTVDTNNAVKVQSGTGANQISLASGLVALTAAEHTSIAADVWDAAQSGHTASGSFGQAAQAIRAGTAQAGAAGTITLDSGASASDNWYQYTAVQITAGAGAGQTRLITGYTGSTKVAAVTPNWTTNPDATSVFVVRPVAEVVANSVIGAVGSVTGAVGSVTGAVGSVTGAVGSVTGAVGSVTGAVGSVTGNVAGSVVGDVQGKVIGGGASALTGVGVQADLEQVGGAALGTHAAGQIPADLRVWLGSAPDALSSGKAPSDVKLWLTVAPNALASGRVDASVGAYPGNTVQTGDAYARIGAAGVGLTAVGLASPDTAVLQSGTAQAGGASTITLSSGASATDNLYVGDRVKVYGGTGAGQSRTITGYVGSTKVATVDRAWTVNPDNTSTYAVVEADNSSLNASLQVATTASDPWGTALPGAYGAGTAGNIVGNNLNAAVGSRMATFTLPTNFSALAIDGSGRMDLGKWIGVAPLALTSQLVQTDVEQWLKGAVNALVSGRVDASVGAYPGNTAQSGDNFARLGAPAGASVSADIAAAKSDTGGLRADYTTGRAGKLDNLDAAVSTRSAPGTAQTIDQTTAIPGSPSAGTIGEALKFADTRLDATVSSRSTLAAGAQMDLVNAPNATALVAVANALLDLTNAIETGETPRQTIRLLRAALAGVSGNNSGTGTVTFRRKDGTTTALTVVYDNTASRTASTVGTV